jgi:hypothetical protein
VGGWLKCPDLIISLLKCPYFDALGGMDG